MNQPPGVIEAFQAAPALGFPRRCVGMDIRLDAGPDLGAAGSAEAFAQAIANVLANCARHAASGRVHVRAAAQRGTRLEVNSQLEAVAMLHQLPRR